MNLVAEDDYIAHDNTVANDFSGMLRHHMVSRIEDQTLLNFTVRYGRSNPHSALGYLVHPRTARIVSDWLGPASTETP
jgi:hypothetical protein